MGEGDGKSEGEVENEEEEEEEEAETGVGQWLVSGGYRGGGSRRSGVCSLV